jgi:hypothetical protein
MPETVNDETIGQLKAKILKLDDGDILVIKIPAHIEPGNLMPRLNEVAVELRKLGRRAMILALPECFDAETARPEDLDKIARVAKEATENESHDPEAALGDLDRRGRQDD